MIGNITEGLNSIIMLPDSGSQENSVKQVGLGRADTYSW